MNIFYYLTLFTQAVNLAKKFSTFKYSKIMCQISLYCKDTGYAGADGCQTNRERGVTTTMADTLLVYLQIRTSIYTTFTQ